MPESTPDTNSNIPSCQIENYGLQKQKLVLEDHVGEVLMPGDEFVIPTEGRKITLGPGLKLLTGHGPDGVDKITICKAGVLSKTKSNVYFMEYKARCVSYELDDKLQ